MNIFWSLSTILFSIGDIVANTFINFYIWENTKDFLVLLRYNIFLFTFIPFGAFLFGYIAKKISLKLSYSLGILMYSAQLLLIVLRGTEILNIIILFGFISGIASGAYRLSFNTINQKITDPRNREKYFGSQNAITSLIKLLTPPTLALVVSFTGSYNKIFNPTVFIFILASIFGFLIRVDIRHGRYKMEDVLRFPGTNPEKTIIFKSLLINGMRSSLMFSILPVITLILVGGLANWGGFTLALSSFGVLASYIYGRISNISNSKYSLTISALIFSLAAIFFAVYFNLPSLIAFAVALAILEIVIVVSFESNIDTLTEQDSKIEYLMTEYNVFTEIAVAIGRIVPLMALYFLDISLQNDIFLRIAFLVVGALPIIMLSILAKSPEILESTV